MKLLVNVLFWNKKFGTSSPGPLRGEKSSKPRPQNRILVTLRNSFKNLPQAPPSFLYGNSPPVFEVGGCPG